MKIKLITTLFTLIAFFVGGIDLSILPTSAGKDTEGSAFSISLTERTKLQSPVIERLLDSEPESVYSGDLLKAFLVAYKSFNTDSAIPLSKRAIENYQIEFRQDKESYFVVFTIGSKTKGKAKVGGESDLTKSVLYVIGKRDYALRSKSFFR
jgi:hypothetical protein